MQLRQTLLQYIEMFIDRYDSELSEITHETTEQDFEDNLKTQRTIRDLKLLQEWVKNPQNVNFDRPQMFDLLRNLIEEGLEIES